MDISNYIWTMEKLVEALDEMRDILYDIDKDELMVLLQENSNLKRDLEWYQNRIKTLEDQICRS